MAIVIELAARGHKSAGFQRYNAQHIRIGRAYDNDLIIDEVHVSPHHAELIRDEDGTWWLHDLNSTNGLMNRRHQPLPSPLRINSGDEVWLGKAHVRFFEPAHQVEDAVHLGATETVLHSMTSPVLAFLIVVCAIALLTGIEWQQSFKPFRWKEFLPEAIGLPVLAIVWASIWAGIGRLLKHDSRFVAQIIISFMYLIAMQLWIGITAVVAFNSSAFVVYKTLLYGGSGALLAMLLLFNLRLATSMSARQRATYANGIAWSLVALMVVLAEYGTRERFGQPKYVSVMFPPITRVVPSVGVQQYYDDSQYIFDREPEP